MTDQEQHTLRRPSRHGPAFALGTPRLSRSVEEAVSESNRPSLRPILAAKSRSVDSSPCSTQRRNVSFQLPEPRDSAVSRVVALAQRLKKLTTSPSPCRTKPEKATKRILRQPVVHVYLRGASGLPTQRVPLSAVYRVSRDFRASSVS